MSNSPEPVAFAVVRADDTIAQMFDTNAEAQEYAGKLNRRLPGDYRVEPLVLRSSLSEERGVRETMEARVRLFEAVARKAHAALRVHVPYSEEGYSGEVRQRARAAIEALGVYDHASLTAEPPALLASPHGCTECGGSGWVIRGTEETDERCTNCGPWADVTPEPPALESPSELTAPSEDEIRAAIRVLEWVKRDAVDAQDYAQAADLRGGQFRLERLLPVVRSVDLPSPPEGEPTQEPNYEAAVEAFNQRVAYWAPEWISSPEHVYEAIAAAVDAAQARPAVSETEEEH